MANRVEMGPNGLRISKPGFNVLTQPEIGKNVAFDTRWAASSMIVTAGTVALSSSTSAVTINYGVTLPTIPVVLVLGRYRSDSSRFINLEAYGSGSAFMTHGEGQSSTDAECQQFMNLTRDPPLGIEKFTNRFVYTPAGFYNQFDRLTYVVLRP